MKTTGRLRMAIFTSLAPAPSSREADDSLLFEAVKKQDKAEVEMLLVRGADVNARGVDGYTPLMRAAKKDIAGLLLSAQRKLPGAR